jgi:hypothetical protein
MFKTLVQYKDFDGISRSDNVYFNMSAGVIMDHLEIVDEMQAIIAKLSIMEDNQKDFSTEDTRQVLDVVKKVMRLAYGERDGDRFIQGEEVWIPFTQTPKYDALLLSFFTDPEKNFLPFCQQVISPELLAQIPKSDETATDENPLGTFEGLPAPEAEPEEKTEYDFTRQELLDMPQQEFDELVGTDPRKMSKLALGVATQRKVRGN